MYLILWDTVWSYFGWQARPRYLQRVSSVLDFTGSAGQRVGLSALGLFRLEVGAALLYRARPSYLSCSSGVMAIL